MFVNHCAVQYSVFIYVRHVPICSIFDNFSEKAKNVGGYFKSFTHFVVVDKNFYLFKTFKDVYLSGLHGSAWKHFKHGAEVS